MSENKNISIKIKADFNQYLKIYHNIILFNLLGFLYLFLIEHGFTFTSAWDNIIIAFYLKKLNVLLKVLIVDNELVLNVYVTNIFFRIS